MPLCLAVWDDATEKVQPPESVPSVSQAGHTWPLIPTADTLHAWWTLPTHECSHTSHRQPLPQCTGNPPLTRNRVLCLDSHRCLFRGIPCIPQDRGPGRPPGSRTRQASSSSSFGSRGSNLSGAYGITRMRMQARHARHEPTSIPRTPHHVIGLSHVESSFFYFMLLPCPWVHDRHYFLLSDACETPIMPHRHQWGRKSVWVPSCHSTDA